MQIEKEIERLAIRTQKELVLLHREGGPNPSGTVHWLNMRTWVSQHHHVRCPHRMFTRKSQYRIVSVLFYFYIMEISVIKLKVLKLFLFIFFSRVHSTVDES